ncbi:hypothetical protein POM88_000704 [Heracleum sosnowskyi]|uniref:Uncharacterized protein n=1 Tax=Heracleum sosnowskyi TaxID=360622 RepID=A0AAD8JCQ4_9APIA|nr:hypothetical protein POM88_000704 [Heracleum sosnowskyi]
MKTNALKLPRRLYLKRKFEAESDVEKEKPDSDVAKEKSKEKDFSDYTDDDMFDAEEIEVFPVEIIDGRKQAFTGAARIKIIYDSLCPPPNQTLIDNMLLYLSNLAICVYNMMEGTYFCDVKLLRATNRGYRLYQVITTYDSSLDSRYSLALYLSRVSLVSYYRTVLAVNVAKHDIESLKVLKLVKSVAKVPTYLITFQAPLLAETEGKSVETFETEICIRSLYPTIVIELKSDARVIPA